MEAKMQKLKVVHVEQVSVLHKRIAMLQLDTRLDKVVSTQTDPFGEDSDCTNMKSELIQTETEWDRGSVNEVLKSHDDQLAEIIAEIENAKIQAQSDYKFAVVQMEQGLREEHEEEVRDLTITIRHYFFLFSSLMSIQLLATRSQRRERKTTRGNGQNPIRTTPTIPNRECRNQSSVECRDQPTQSREP